MKTTFLLSPIFPIFIIAVCIFTPAVGWAADGAQLYEKLTCHTCHGAEGRGMIRTEDKVNFRLRKKKMYRTMIKKGVPKKTVQKLIPLYKKKFTDEASFVQAITEHIGAKKTAKYKATIMEIAGRVYWREGDLIRGFEDYPRHAGNKRIYLYRQMKDILEGRRTNGNSEAMRGIKPYIDNNQITDDDYKSIAEYLSNVK